VGEDLVTGKYNDVDLAFSELHTQYKTTSKNSKGSTTTHWHTVFKGLFVIVDFHKNFKHKTMVVPDFAEKMFGQLIGNFMQRNNFARSGKLCRMEDVEFEKIYAVYAHDDIEARYLLSPHLMSEMVKMRQRFGCNIYFSFIKSKLFIAIESKYNFFERPKSIDVNSLCHTFNEINTILKIVDDLNLDTRIWSKE
ncbi:MAG: DUF3137 domain-containing protein, partial [Lentisphaeria bacterium]